MDKSAIRNFAIEARKMLMKSAETEAGFYGVTKNGCKSPIQKGNDFEVYETIAGTENRIYGADIKRRANLVKAVETLGFEQVIEETAYTWFNRIIAIRFMEVNDYLPTRVRVLSSETGSSTPDIVTQSLDVDLNMTSEELDKVQKAKDENRYDDAFRMLFIKQCNELNAILPGLFGKTDDYMELLLKLSYTSDGVVRMLVDSIDENNFNVETEGQVEIIGWMYQYYNTELKDDTFAKLKKNVKITKDRIPAATQLFTPDWIVRYMVENSVGRVWIEHLRAKNPSLDERAQAESFGWNYYLEEAEQEECVQSQLVEVRKSYEMLEPKDINCIDPCMGSGHVLVYMFDVLMQIYVSEGFGERDAVFSILENNIRGLDIDGRAYQLAYFALMMKARGYNRTFFRGKNDENGEKILTEPRVFVIEESNDVNREQIKYFGSNLSEIEQNNAVNQLTGLLDSLKNAREYGSIINIEQYDWDLLEKFVCEYDICGQISFDTYGIDETRSKLVRLIKQSKTMTDTYFAVVTNPPYMNNSGMNKTLSDFCKKNYSTCNSDLSTVMMDKGIRMCKKLGFMAMINIPVWMFITSYAKMRKNLIENTWIYNMLHLGRGVFGSDFGTTAFVIRNIKLSNVKGLYYKLYKRQGEVDSIVEKERLFNERYGEYICDQEAFTVIPDSPIAYWASEQLLNDFENGVLVSKVAQPRQGMSTCDVNRFTKLWFEVDKARTNLFDEGNIGYWVKYNKGGSFRRWYGNRDYVVFWGEDGEQLQQAGALLRNREVYLSKFLAWTKISSAGTGFRKFDRNFLFDGAGGSLFVNEEYINELYLLGLLNSKVCTLILNLISPTLNFNENHIGSIPMLVPDEEKVQEVVGLVTEAVEISKSDWDSYENSWDYQKNPLVEYGIGLIKDAYKKWEEKCDERFYRLKDIEESLNRIFIEVYKLENELLPEIEENEVTIRRAEQKRDIKGLISFAVGNMFGRYSVYEQGLRCAGVHSPLPNNEFVDYDNVIQITDESYFEDDIVGKFVKWVSEVFGAEYLEENLEFIASVLDGKGNTARDVIRSYFLNEFYVDHCNIYSVTGSGKRPIYWMFDSGKENGFKCLIYMHRYTKDTLNLVRAEYLHKTQDAIENALKNAEYIIQTSSSAVERAKATKDRDRYVKQLNEMRIYYQALSHLALQKIEIDLDDGVKHNYQLFQGIEVIADGGKKQKVDLLAKI